MNFAQKGKEFLEYKREQIIFLIRKYWEDYLNQRTKFLNDFRQILIKLNQNYEEMGKRQFTLISSLSKIQYKPFVNVKYTKEYGNVIPQIDFELIRKETLPAYSFDRTSHYLDDLIRLLQDLFKDMILLAEKEGLMLSYSFNFKKISRRINSLENVIIPKQKTQIKKIKEILEENERENFVRLKKTKDLIKEKQNAT